MEFAFTEEQGMIGETVRGFFTENATSERTRAAMKADGFDRELWTSFATELGLAGIGLPEEQGGAGLGISARGKRNSNSASTSSTDSTRRAPSLISW